jgi:acyl-coenzyme A thioesterase PaaI-like protein
MAQFDATAILELIPFAAALGIELHELDPDQVQASLKWTPERTTTADVMHGGAIMAGRSVSLPRGDGLLGGHDPHLRGR